MARAAAKVSPFRLTSFLRLEKDPEVALRLFRSPNPNSQSVKPYRYSARSYDLIICKLGRARKFPEMEQILDQMIHDTTRFTPKESLFCDVISFYVRARMPSSALATFNRIPSFRCRRSIRSFNSLLNAFLSCGHLHNDSIIISDLPRHLDALHLQPDACTYNILIRASNSLPRALELFDEMLNRRIQPSIVTFGTLMSALCKNEKIDEAFQLKDQMLRLYNLKPNVYIYTSLIKALCRNERLEEALSLKKEIVGLDSAVYSTVIRALFRAGRKGEVVDMLEEMKRNNLKPDVVTYNAMIAGFCEDTDFDAAFEVVNQMEREGVKPDVLSYNMIISTLCKEGRWKDAVEIFADMPRRGCKPDVLSYKMVFEGLCDAKKFKEARHVLDEMLFKGYQPGEGSLSKLVEGFCRDGDWGIAVEVLCRLAKGSKGVWEVWEIAIKHVVIERELLKAGEHVDCLMFG